MNDAMLTESAAKAEKTARRLKNETLVMQREIKLLKEEAVEREEEMQSLRDENAEVHNLRVRCFELEQQHERDGLLHEQGTALSAALQASDEQASDIFLVVHACPGGQPGGEIGTAHLK